ncbi:MAG: enoyl-CoA hydratase-related protein [Treponema sp.]|nr:enoyl-CoA hydratase-related protein [Treponema sp.]
MANTTFEFVADKGTAVLTVTRPEQLNALNRETMAEIASALDRAAGEKGLRSLVVTGAGAKAFVAGADIKQLEGLDGEGAHRLSTEGNRVFSMLAELPFPTIAAVNGYAFGGGCELALACDIRLAAENASFALPEVSLGVCPGWGGTQRLARLVGTGLAAELLFSAGRVNAERACRIGLVNAVHPQEKLLEAALELAAGIGRNAPLAVAACKRAMYAGIEVPLARALEIEAGAFAGLFGTDDAKKGLAAFGNKEKYEFAGE